MATSPSTTRAPLVLVAAETDRVAAADGGVATVLKLPPTLADAELPLVSLLTPTYGRSYFHALAQYVVQHVDYPATHLEWIVVDDSPPGQGWDAEPAFKKFQETWGAAPGLGPQTNPGPRLRYIRLEQGTKMPLGKKRNFLAALARAELLVHLDDDDYYPPETLLARVKTLIKYRAGCVASTRVPCYDLVQQTAFEAFEPAVPAASAPGNVSEATLCYTKSFWRARPFAEDALESEGYAFVQDRPAGSVIDVPGAFVIRALTHMHNCTRGRFVPPDATDLPTAQRQGRQVWTALPEPVQRILQAVRQRLAATDGPVLKMYEYLQRLQQHHKGKPQKLAKILDAEDPAFRSHPVVYQFRNGLKFRHLPAATRAAAEGGGPVGGPRQLCWYVDARGPSSAASGGVPTAEFLMEADDDDVGGAWIRVAGEAAAATVRVAEAVAATPRAPGGTGSLIVLIYVPALFKGGAGPRRLERVCRGVTYRPWYTWNPRDEQDVWMAWKYPDVVDVQTGPCYGGRYWDAVEEASPAQVTSQRVARLRGIWHRSRWLSGFFEDVNTALFQHTCTPLGLDLPDLPDDGLLQQQQRRVQHVVCLDDAPNGVETVLKLWPRVAEAVAPAVKLCWRGHLPRPTREGGPTYASWATSFQQLWKGLVEAGHATADDPVTTDAPGLRQWYEWCAEHRPVVVSATTRLPTSPLVTGAVYAVALAAGARLVLPNVGAAADLLDLDHRTGLVDVGTDPQVTARDIHRGLVDPDHQDAWVAAVIAAATAPPRSADEHQRLWQCVHDRHGRPVTQRYWQAHLCAAPSPSQ